MFTENVIHFLTKPRRCPKAAQGAPMGSKGIPKDGQSHPEDTQGHPEGNPRATQGSQRKAKDDPKAAKGTPREPKAPQRTDKGSPHGCISNGSSSFSRKRNNMFRLRRRDRIAVQGTHFLCFCIHFRSSFFPIVFSCFLAPPRNPDSRVPEGSAAEAGPPY